VNANSKKHKDVIKALCELMYIRAKLDTGLTEEYRKYWKAQGIDYRWILEIKDKLDEVCSDDYSYNIYLLRSELTDVVQSALKDWSLKAIMKKHENKDNM